MAAPAKQALVALVVGALGVAGLALWGARSARSPTPTPTPAHALVEDVVFRVVRGVVPGTPRAPKFSPRGQYLAFHLLDGEQRGRLMLAHMGTRGTTDVVEVLHAESGVQIDFRPDITWHPAPALAASGAVAGAGEVLWRALPRRTPQASALLAVDRAPPPQRAVAFNAAGRRLLWVHGGGLWGWDVGAPDPSRIGEGEVGISRALFEPVATRLLVEQEEGGTPAVWVWSADGAERERLSVGPARQAGWAGVGRAVWLEQGAGGLWGWRRWEDGKTTILAEGVRVSPAGGSGLSEIGDWVGWGAADAERRVRFTRVADGHTIAVKVPCRDVEDVVIAQGFSQAWAAFTCLAKADEPRVLVVGEVTSILGVPPQ